MIIVIVHGSSSFVCAAVTKCDAIWELLTFYTYKMSTFQELRTALFFVCFLALWPHICDVSSGFWLGHSIFFTIK